MLRGVPVNFRDQADKLPTRLGLGRGHVTDPGREIYLDNVLRFENDPLESIGRLVSLVNVDDDYVVYENAGVWTFAGGIFAEVWLDSTGAHLRSPESRRDIPWSGDPLAQVQALLDELPYRRWCAYGWSAFELSCARDGNLSDVGNERLLQLVIPRTEVRVTAEGAHIRCVDRMTLGAVEEALHDHSPIYRPGPSVLVDVRSHGAHEYQTAVARAVNDIKGKVLDKVVVSRVVPVPVDLDFIKTYVVGRRANNPARSFLMSLNGLDALGFSPEVMVRVESSGAVISQPLAGTRALTADRTKNARLREELLSDPKEVFEHAISVKVVYDELRQVCGVDSLSVHEFMSIRERGTVQHLASEVSGQLAEGRRALDAFGAVFPAVTASGIPKAVASAYIRDHEPERRGLYGAAVLTVDHEGTLDAAVVLRAVYRQNGRTWLRAGGGVVGQSTPARELEETCEKLGSVANFLIPRVASTGRSGHSGAGPIADGHRSTGCVECLSPVLEADAVE